MTPMHFLAFLAQTEPFDLEGLLNRWGLPLVLLGAVGFAVWKLMRWMEPRANRLVDSHVDLVETLKKRLEQIEENSEEANKRLESIDRKVGGTR